MPNFCCFIFSDSLTAAQSHATKMPIFSIFFSFQKYEVEVDVIKLVSEKIRDEREVVRSNVRSFVRLRTIFLTRRIFSGKNIFLCVQTTGSKGIFFF
jgi:acyl-CoA thioesterase